MQILKATVHFHLKTNLLHLTSSSSQQPAGGSCVIYARESAATIAHQCRAKGMPGPPGPRCISHILCPYMVVTPMQACFQGLPASLGHWSIAH